MDCKESLSGFVLKSLASCREIPTVLTIHSVSIKFQNFSPNKKKKNCLLLIILYKYHLN